MKAGLFSLSPSPPLLSSKTTTSDMVGLEAGDWVHIRAICITFFTSSAECSFGSKFSSNNSISKSSSYSLHALLSTWKEKKKKAYRLNQINLYIEAWCVANLGKRKILIYINSKTDDDINANWVGILYDLGCRGLSKVSHQLGEWGGEGGMNRCLSLLMVIA